jgi:hypothetical protein
MEKKEKKEHAKTVALLIWSIPSNLRDAFKSKCAERKTTMKKAIIDFMRSFCAGH